MTDPKLLFPFSVNSNLSKARVIESYNKFSFTHAGKDLLDLSLGNCGCFMLGFDRLDIIENVNQRMKQNPFVSGEYMTTNTAVLELTQCLYDLSGGYRSVFSLSGSDAIEGAIKLAKLYHSSKGSNRNTILGVKDSYHGSTYLTSSIGQLEYMTKAPADHCVALKESELIDFIKNNSVACLIIETCSWSKGLRQNTNKFWKELRQVCRDHDVVFIIDDIAMCGGKTGSFFGFDPSLKPDLFCLGKAFSGGYFPLSACLVSQELHSVIKQEFLAHGFTYSFSLSGIYSTLEYLGVLEKENHLANYNTSLTQMFTVLDELKSRNIIHGYRNYGLMFDLDITSTSEQTFYDNGLNIGVWNNGQDNLMLVVPLNAELTYFNTLQERLISSLRGA
jgi:adenosylmethionine-8-amino-7-oxononanoate aminotransferase